MRWQVHGERPLYESEWVGLSLVDVEVPGEGRFEHHVVRVGHDAAGAVIHDPDRGILMLWRHRFITDTWGWEIPAGKIEDGESPVEAAARESVEESGWAPRSLRHLVSYHPSNGLSDQRFHLFLSDGATHVGDPVDVHEAERIEWVPMHEVEALIRRNEMTDGLSLTAVLYALTFDAIR